MQANINLPQNPVYFPLPQQVPFLSTCQTSAEYYDNEMKKLNDYILQQSENGKQLLTDLSQLQKKLEDEQSQEEILIKNQANLKSQAEFCKKKLELQKLIASTNECLNVEKASLLNQIQLKSVELEEWRTLLADYQQELEQIPKTTDQDIEKAHFTIFNLQQEHQYNNQNIEQFCRRNMELEVEKRCLQEIQEEVNKLNSEIQSKNDDNKTLEVEIQENVKKSKQMKDKENEIQKQLNIMKQEIENLQNQQVQIENDKNQQINQVSDSFNQNKQLLIQNHQQVVNALTQNLLACQQQSEQKQQEIVLLKQKVEEINLQIAIRKQNAQNLIQQAIILQQNIQAVQNEHQQELQKINKNYDNQEALLKQDFSIFSAQKAKNINDLQQRIVLADQKLQDLNQILRKNNIQKSQLETVKQVLENNLEETRQQKELAEKERRRLQEAKEIQNQVELQQLSKSQQIQKNVLLQQAKQLDVIALSKQNELLKASQIAEQSLLRAAEAQLLEKKKAEEAEFWKNQYRKTEREKSLDIEAAKRLRQLQIEQMQLRHNQETLNQDLERRSLIQIVDIKDQEVKKLRDSYGNLVHELAETQVEKRQADITNILTRSQLMNNDLNRNIKQEMQVLKSTASIEDVDSGNNTRVNNFARKY